MMDTKEALKELEDLTVDYGDRNEEQIARLDEAIDMAMDALRAQSDGDTISRQATIDAMENVDWYHISKDGRLVHGANSDDHEPLYKAKDVYTVLNTMPSAQPEPCVDTIDALDESIKHFDDMAEECRRNANIEQNDYMDMRDDAAEYRQLSIWLNELKWLRERFQSQPDLSEYSDKLWKAAYERGKAEALDEIVRCKECRFYKSDGCFFSTAEIEEDGFCSWAERRTDE